MKKPLKESAVAIIRHAGTGRILFLERKEGWCLPGGKMDAIDKSITHCAHRELEEETGITCNWGLLKFLGIEHAVNGRTVYVFHGEHPFKEVKLSKEHTAYKWVDPHDIPHLTLAGNTGQFLKLYKFE